MRPGKGGHMWSRLVNSDSSSPFSETDRREVVGEASSTNMESLDYEVVESLAYREDQVQI